MVSISSSFLYISYPVTPLVSNGFQFKVAAFDKTSVTVSAFSSGHIVSPVVTVKFLIYISKFGTSAPKFEVTSTV